jgi:hypothetical protein
MFALVLMAFCGGVTSTSSPSPRRDDEAARQEIRGRIAAIRDAIVVKNAAGIVQSGTEDGSFTGPDGVSFDRAGFVKRTEAPLARIVAIESLTTAVDGIEFPETERARVEITQTMVRSERAAKTGMVSRVGLRYREEQTWVRVGAAGGVCRHPGAPVPTPRADGPRGGRLRTKNRVA